MHLQHSYMRAQIFIFILRIVLLVGICIVLHLTQTTLVRLECAGLWESMLVILVAKCIRMLFCVTAVKLLKRDTHVELNRLYLFNLVIDTAFFTTECVMTSKSLNSEQCVVEANKVFGGHPMIMYVNSLACFWDGSFILSHVLFLMLGF
jgi:hypothetical protein